MRPQMLSRGKCTSRWYSWMMVSSTSAWHQRIRMSSAPTFSMLVDGIKHHSHEPDRTFRRRVY
jgi:hypothetical protein